jgi:hypothetical protein
MMVGNKQKRPLHYGLLSYDSKSEIECMDKADKLSQEIMGLEDYE